MSDGFSAPLEGELLLALVRLAIAPAGEPAHRLAALRQVAAGSAKAGDQEGAVLALREGIDMLRGIGSGSKFAVPAEAYRLGRQAASLGLPEIAREAYEAGLAGVGQDVQSPDRGPLRLAIGDAWCLGGDGEKGIESYREAVAANRLASIPTNRLASLTALIEAEGRAGRGEDLEALIDEGILVAEHLVANPEEQAEVAVHRFGRAAEAVGQPERGRRIYELTLDLLGEGSERLSPAIVWQDVGDTWLTENDGPQALRAYRKASGEPAFLGPANHLILLSDLAPVELHWGERSACEAAIRRAAELLEEIPPSTAAKALGEALTALAEVGEQVGCFDLAATFAGRSENGHRGDPPS